MSAWVNALLTRTRTCVLARGAAAIVLAASAASAQVGPLKILDHVRVDARKPIDFHAAAYPETLFVGQQVTYQVAVLLNADARSRLRRNPEFLPPELRGLLAYELGTPSRVPPRSMGGGEYEAHVFQRALFPVAAGALAVPAPQLTYGLPQSSSYFSREERYIVRAESAHLVIKSLPAEGRPDTFTGAVGVLRATARLSAATARVGDPLILTMRLQGVGNVKLLPRPNIEIEWASAVPGSERVVVDTSGPLVRGAKEFDWILTPAESGSVVLPSLRYDYFDPYLKKYTIAETKPTPLEVQAGVLAADDVAESITLLPLRPLRTPTRTFTGLALTERGAYVTVLVLCLLAPVAALMLSIRRRPRRLRSAPPLTADALRVADDTDGARDLSSAARHTRRTLHALLATRLRVPAHEIIARRQLQRVLRRRGVSRDTTRRVIACFDHLDEGAFAAQASTPSLGSAQGDDVAALYAAVDAEAVRGGRAIPTARYGVLFGAAIIISLTSPFGSVMLAQGNAQRNAQGNAQGAANAATSSEGPSDAAFSLASDAYEARRFTEASSRFADLARVQPRHVGILANWGTAAWANGDTVDAVRGWQRAARLDPMAPDLHERLALLPAGARSGFADVPMVPVPLLQAAAVVAWLLAWCLVGVIVWHRTRRAPLRWERATRAVACVVGVLAVAAGATAVWGRRALDANALAVVTRPETMHVAPGTDADAMGGVSTGDVVRVIERRDDWQHVQHSDGRVGWVPVIRLVALVDTPTSQ